MIKPLKPRAPVNAISVYDIETASDGTLLDIGFRHSFIYETFTSWLDFLAFIYEEEPEEKISVVWAHNGGKFDTVALICEMYKNEKLYSTFIKDYSARLINGSILELDIEFKNGEHVLFRDSFRLFPMSLEKALQSMTGKGKDDVPKEYKSKMELFKEKFPLDYYAYLKQDCDGLFEALTKFRNLVNDISPIGDLPLSLGSLALKVFRTSFLHEEIRTPNELQKEFTERAYSGGRTEFFGMGKIGDVLKIKFKKIPFIGFDIFTYKNVYPKCNYYDYNSMYPAEMLAGLFPFGQCVWTKTLEFYDDGITPIPGAYEIDFYQTGGHIPLLRGWMNGKKTKEHVWQGSGVYTSDEVLYLQNIGATVNIIKGCYYPDSKPLFREFILFFYELRMKSREEKNAALDLVCKLIMNNLYGKFGQREEGEELRFLSFDEAQAIIEAIQTGKEQKIISISFMSPDSDEPNESGVCPFAVKTRTFVSHRFPLIAALITGRARCKITGLSERYWQDAIYCDTDSFVTQATIDPALICPNTLGMLKPEYENVTMEFWGRKQYRIIEKNELKQKGVKIKDAETFAAQVTTPDGYEAEYFAPAGIKQSIKKDLAAPNKFERYTRVIKNDLSSYEKGLIKVDTY